MSPVKWLCVTLILACSGRASGQDRGAAIAELLEDNAAKLLPLLTNPTGDPGEGHVEETTVFAGTSGVRIVPMQCFHPGIPGWKYRIVEKPGPGEFRYVRFAWRADGCAGIMLQFHDATDWNVRYTAGVDRYGWGTKFVADTPPDKWVVVTRDLFEDFGERTIQGMALTAFEGESAYFDHIYFGRTIEDLDRIDATGFADRELPALKPDELDRLWIGLASDDASVSYSAFWRLIAGRAESIPFLKRKLAEEPVGADPADIRRWIRDLDDPTFRVRQTASERLARHVEAAADLMDEALWNDPSAEVRLRIERLFASRGGREGIRNRSRVAERILKLSESLPRGADRPR